MSVRLCLSSLNCDQNVAGGFLYCIEVKKERRIIKSDGNEIKFNELQSSSVLVILLFVLKPVLFCPLSWHLDIKRGNWESESSIFWRAGHCPVKKIEDVFLTPFLVIFVL